MKNWVRKIRAAIGVGVAWGAAWFGAGMVLLLIVGPDAADVPFPLFFGLLGFLAGITFSGILGMVERRRRFDEMSLRRFAGWGAAGGLLLSGFVVITVALLGDATLDMLVLGPVFALAGAASAAGSLALARRAEDGALLEAGREADDVGLSEGEVRERLGGRTPD